MENVKELARYSLTKDIDTQKYVISVVEDFIKYEYDSDLLFYAGLLSANLGKYEQSIYYYKESIRLNPSNKNAYFDIGAILFHMGEWDEAIEYGEKLFKLDNTFQNISLHLANSYSQIGLYQKANTYFRIALESNPDNIQIWSDYILSLNYTNYSIDERKKIQDHYRNLIFQNTKFPKINKKEKIRLGYVSFDFCNHPATYFYKGLITKHTIELFDIYFYSTNIIEDDITVKFKESGNYKCITDPELLYHTIKNDSIDILIDLNGYTRGNSLQVFLHNPAPIQITWLGFLNSMAISSLPYKITDKNLIKDSVVDYYTENLLILDNSLYYEPPTTYPAIKPSPYIQNGHITFGYFNNFRKLSDEVLEAWIEILLYHKNSKFIFIKSEYKKHNDEIFTFFNQKGFYNIEMYDRANIYMFMDILSKVDVCFDPFPHVGGATTAHSLWMGVPVLTKEGLLENERISSALLKNVDLEWFIAQDKEEYISKGKNIDIQYISSIRQDMRNRFPEYHIILNQIENMYVDLYKAKLIDL